MIKITVNGKSVELGDVLNICMRNNSIVADGKVIDLMYNNDSVVYIEGAVNNIDTDLSVNCKEVSGNIKAGGSVNCKGVGGDVHAGGSVNCKDIGGNVIAGGSINRR